MFPYQVTAHNIPWCFHRGVFVCRAPPRLVGRLSFPKRTSPSYLGARMNDAPSKFIQNYVLCSPSETTHTPKYFVWIMQVSKILICIWLLTSLELPTIFSNTESSHVCQ